MTSRLQCILAGLGIAFAIAGTTDTAIAADPEPCQPSGATAIDVYKVGDPGVRESAIEVVNQIAVEVDNLARFRAEAICRKKSILLFVNGQATANRYAALAPKDNNALVFFLRHVGATPDFWNVLRGGLDFGKRPLGISVGIEDQPPLPVK